MQMIAAAFFLWVMNKVGWIKLQPVSVERALRVFPITLLYVGSVGFALASLSYLSVPIYKYVPLFTIIPCLVVWLNFLFYYFIIVISCFFLLFYP